MEENQVHPMNVLAQKFLIEQLNSSNQFVDDLLEQVQTALTYTIPNKKTEIEGVINKFKHPFNSCSSLVNKSSKLIKLPISVQMRENGQENKEGIYAVSITENLGIKVLEWCCRKIVSISEEITLVEARKFESELNCFCTIPKSSHSIELIESGSKYELVFEKKVQTYPKLAQILKQPVINQKRQLTEPLESHRKPKQSNIPNNDYRHEAMSPNDSTTNFDSSCTDGNSLLSRLFSRDAETSESNNLLPDTPNNSSSGSWANRDLESARLLPEFDPFEIFTSSSRGCQILEHLKHYRMDKNDKTRINFVQIIGKYFLEEIRPKLSGPATAALRRSFINKVFTTLETVIQPLPSQEEFSNRMGKGFFDVYLKHQNTKSRRILPTQRQNANVEDFARSLIDNLDQPNHLAYSNESSQSPVGISTDQSSIKSENYGIFD